MEEEREGEERERSRLHSMYCTNSLFVSPGNAAERLFAKMKTKDGASYDAMIQGLVKVLLMFVLTHSHKPYYTDLHVRCTCIL